jgi:hypothetical protein
MRRATTGIGLAALRIFQNQKEMYRSAFFPQMRKPLDDLRVFVPDVGRFPRVRVQIEEVAFPLCGEDAVLALAEDDLPLSVPQRERCGMGVVDDGTDCESEAGSVWQNRIVEIMVSGIERFIEVVPADWAGPRRPAACGRAE